MKNIATDWRSVSYSRHGRHSVPRLSGVYAIMRVERVMGLHLQSQVLYVGKAKNLRSRLGQHLNPATAHNEEVAAARDKASLEFWCNLVPGEHLDLAEQHLIRNVKPKANKIRY